jgi:tripartite-type tricarboxylate transporter receptor subunit TctC
MKSSCRSTASRLLRAVIATALVGNLAACGVENGSGGDSGGDADYPSKAIELTAPSSAGGSTDLISRAIAKSAKKPFGETVVVVNK